MYVVFLFFYSLESYCVCTINYKGLARATLREGGIPPPPPGVGNLNFDNKDVLL